MHRLFYMAALTFFACGAGIIFADGPTTAPSKSPADTFKEFLVDIQQGNAADLDSLCVAQGDRAKQLRSDFEALAGAMGNLRATATAKFGADAGKSVLPALPSLDDLDDVNETINGDAAQVSGTSIWPIHLLMIHDRWRIDLDWLAQSGDMPANPRWFAQMAQAVRKTGDDIASGRLTTIDAASEAMLARQQAIPDSDTTQPATQP